MAYTTNTAVKLYIGGIQGSGDDTLLTGLIADAEVYIEDYTNRIFEAETATRKFNAIEDVDGRKLWLDEDLISITTLTNGDSSTISSSQYVLLPTNLSPKYAIKLLGSSGVAWQFTDDPEEAISVAGSWGYAATVPTNIIKACKLLAAYDYRSRQAGPDAERTIIAGGTVIAPSRIPSMVEELIAPYRKVLV